MPPASRSNRAPAWSPEDLAADPHAAGDKAERVESMFTSIAPRYDLNNRLHSLWRDQAWRRRVVALAAVTPEDDVLDLACGTGDLTELLAAARPRSIVGMDFTEAMLEVARAKASRRRGAGTPATYVQGDAMAIDLPDASVDLITIAFGIRNVTEPGVAVGECGRILRPGGRLLVLEFSTPRRWIPRMLNELYSRHIMPRTATAIAGDRSGAYHYLPRSVQTFADPANLAAMIESQQFDVRRQVPQTFGICTITVADRR
jgi:demethylmenaquinone methyltransferase/2-methoxy-6-polyprenyl-1,4-benzoquinol methylase